MKKRFTVIFISMLLAVSLLTACTSETTEKYVYEGSTVDDFKSASYGDSIYFGSYEQDNNLENGKEAILLSFPDAFLYVCKRDTKPIKKAVLMTSALRRASHKALLCGGSGFRQTLNRKSL